MPSYGPIAPNIGSKILRIMLYLANQFSVFGFGLNWAYLYSYELDRFRTDCISAKGKLRDGRPYELICTDVATPEEKAEGIAHYRIACVSEGKELGRVRIWAGEKYIDPIDKVVRFNGWYALDAYTEPEARGLMVFRNCLLYGIRVAKELGLGGKYYCGFTHAYNQAVIHTLDKMGFTRAPTILFVKVLGKRWWKGVNNDVIS